MLKTRALTALIFAPALLAIIYWGGLALQITCFVLAMLMLWEFLQIVLGEGLLYQKVVAFLLGAAVASFILGWVPGVWALPFAPAFVMLAFIGLLFAPEPINTAMARLSYIVFGAAYCAALIPFLARLRDFPEGLGLALMALFCTWGADTGAYFAGRFLGKRKLYPKVSPAKTVEGALGGLLASVAVAFVAYWLFDMQLPVWLVAGIGAVAAVFDVAGDLCESLLKRSAGVKDSSKLIPGHGGVLDRFDGVMFVAPAIYVTVTLAVHP